MSRLVRVPGKMAQARGTIAYPVAMQNRYNEIAHGCHDLRSGTASNATGILAKRDVSHVVQLILNRPVHSTQTEQVRRSGPLRRQAGDLVMHLRVPARLPLSLVDEPTDLCQTRPGHRFRRRSSSRMEGPNVNASMPAVNCSRTLEHLERRRERNAAEPAGASADCP